MMMKTSRKMKMDRIQRRLTGFSLMEVLIAIAVFAIGMLALAAFQGALTRSAADAKVRTVAVNLAEAAIEAQRGFQLTQSDPAGVLFAYSDIVDGNQTVTRDGVVYTISQDITDYFYDFGTDTYTTTNGSSALTSDYKTVQMTVTWNDGDDVPDFLIQEGVTAGQLGSGSITISGTISAIPTGATGKVVTEADGETIAPAVDYIPCPWVTTSSRNPCCRNRT
jgi:prepilin-type N-terminal cleavage/methylation domain-containing protein